MSFVLKPLPWALFVGLDFLFCTRLKVQATRFNCFFFLSLMLQILGTALLLLFVMALTDSNNSAPSKGLVPLLVGLAVLAIGLSFGVNAGELADRKAVSSAGSFLFNLLFDVSKR